jgi:hypothetical protein
LEPGTCGHVTYVPEFGKEVRTCMRTMDIEEILTHEGRRYVCRGDHHVVTVRLGIGTGGFYIHVPNVPSLDPQNHFLLQTYPSYHILGHGSHEAVLIRGGVRRSPRVGTSPIWYKIGSRYGAAELAKRSSLAAELVIMLHTVSVRSYISIRH